MFSSNSIKVSLIEIFVEPIACLRVLHAWKIILDKVVLYFP